MAGAARGDGWIALVSCLGGLEKAEGETTALPGRKQQKEYELNLLGRQR